MASSYGTGVNYSLLEFLGPLRGTVLDVGCGVGGWAPDLRSLGADRLVGIEPSADAALAVNTYDEVHNLPIDAVAVDAVDAVDAVIFADVLEHLPDPWQALRHARGLAADGASLFVSVPNAQYYRALATIARGDWPLEDHGYWDRTHLRWFTRRSLDGVLTATGWSPARHEYSLGGGRRGSLSRATGGRLLPWLAGQLHMEAIAE